MKDDSHHIMQTQKILQQIAVYLRVVHGIQLDVKAKTYDYELEYYATNLHDSVLFDAWQRYAHESLKGARRYQSHFERFRARLRRSSLRPFYVVARSGKINFRQRLRDEKVSLSWY